MGERRGGTRRVQGFRSSQVLYERAAALGDEDAEKALKRMECPFAIKDKRGNLVTNLCF